MNLALPHVLGAATIGVGASLLMDAWNFFLKRGFGISSLNYCLLGRWLLHMAEGTFSHASITAAPKKHLECTVGWLAHYTMCTCRKPPAAGASGRDPSMGQLTR